MQAIGLSKRDLFADDFASTNGHAASNGKAKNSGQLARVSERPAYSSVEAAVESLEHTHDRANSGLWLYHDRDGDEVGAAVRFDDDGGKVVLPLRRDADGWRVGGMPVSCSMRSMRARISV